MRRLIRRIWCRIHAKLFVNRKLKFVRWFHAKHPAKYCWADCVSWAFNALAFNPYKIESASGCKKESEQSKDATCYCGGWKNGRCWEQLSEQEQLDAVKALRSEFKEEGIPF